MQDDNQEEMSVVCLPDDFTVQQWLVRNGAAVQRGEKVAIAVKKGTSAAPSSIQPPTTAKHKRPNKRKRVQTVAKEESKSMESSTDTPATKPAAAKSMSISAYLPPTPDTVTITASSGGIIRIHVSALSENPLAIASIEPCPHPAIMSGLCALCGASIQPQQLQASSNSTTSNNHNTMSQVTVSGGVTMTISETEARQMSLQTSSRLQGEGKLSLVLDLDHTLVHATSDARAQSHHATRDDVRTLILPIPMNTLQTLWMPHYVKLRPHVEEFLTSLKSKYEISVYTAGTRIYAEHVCMLLSRSIVGATLDEAELQQLKYNVASAEYKMRNKETANRNESTSNDNEKETNSLGLSTTNKGNDDSESAATTTTNGTTTASDVPPPKNKKVSFGEPPTETKTDEMTLEKLQQLQQTLQEAEAMEQKALALRQEIFASRIVSRTDVGDLGRDVKSLERIFPCGGSMALIVDDREDVWANAQDVSKKRGEPPDNLLLIRPYHWKPFLGFADVNNAAGEDISGESTTTKDEDDTALLWTLGILERMHSEFYTKHHANRETIMTVPPLIRDMRAQVLAGCTLVFSGLIPLRQQNQTFQYPRPAVVRYGESLGATVKDNVDDTITHMVAARDGTDKIRLARRVAGCNVVKPSWLMECVWTMTRRDVTPHLLGTPSAAVQKEPQSTAANDSSSSDDDDDDLAAMLEADMME